MSGIRIRPIPTEIVRALQAGGADANGQPAERVLSDDDANPCRHCLTEIPRGRPMLILAHRPFPEAQPYAEQGPIFLCGEPCEPWSGEGVAPLFLRREHMIMRGYGADHRIVYGTGAVVETKRIEAEAERLLARPDIAYLHLRSSTNNCYQARIDRA